MITLNSTGVRVCRELIEQHLTLFCFSQMTEVTNEEITPIVYRSDSSLSRTLDTRSPFAKKFAVVLILISVGFERLAFYSLAGNLTFFLDSNIIGWIFPHTIIAPLIFLGKT